MKKYVLIFVTSAFFCFGKCCQIWSNHLIDLSDVTVSKTRIWLDSYLTHAHLLHLSGVLHTENLRHLKNLQELKICYSIVTKIEDGALCHSSKLQSLELDFLPVKPAPAFDSELLKNCESVKELSFLFCSDCFVSIPSYFFVQLPNLEEITLTGVNLTYFSKHFFGVISTKLTKLVLVNGNIGRILPNALDDFRSLKKLAIVGNPKLEVLPSGLFVNLHKLDDLSLKSNGLQNLTWSEFDGLKHLKRLNLAENKLTSLDAKTIAKLFPNLWFLSIEKNYLSCVQMEKFLSDLWNITEQFMVVYKNDIKCKDKRIVSNELNNNLS